jgi:tetratricopeptide (TPR) repeat protein
MILSNLGGGGSLLSQEKLASCFAPSGASAMAESADADLLFACVAYHQGFVSALAEAMRVASQDPDKDLGQILVEQGWLTSRRRELLQGQAQEHMPAQPVDLHQSLHSAFPDIYRQLIGPAEPSGSQTGPPDTPPSSASLAPTAGVPIPAAAGLRYRKEEKPHAQGGLGSVFKAKDEELNRLVAFKEIRQEYANEPASRSRFLREAEITGKLEHPGVVPVYGLGHDAAGRLWYAMRFIQGESLQTAIERFHAAGANPNPGAQPLTLRQMLASFVTVCKTMAYAHSRGVLHRDLKPANIMLGKYGETLVVDWGLAKSFEREETAQRSDEESLQPGLGGGAETRAGQIVGTPAYCSPEQAAGRWDAVGPTSDVFSLGATLYHLLTNKVPYKSSEAKEILEEAKKGEVIPPRQRTKEVPPPLEAICLKALARERQGRYGTALELAADVERWLADEPVQAYCEPPLVRVGRWLRQHRPLVVGMAAAAAVALISLTVVLLVVAGKNWELQLANQRETARAEAERLAKDEAQKRLVQIEKGADMLGSIFADVDPEAEQNKPLGEILGERIERTAAQLDGESIADLLTVAKLQNILGASLINLGHYSTAQDLLEKSVATRKAQLGDDHPDTLICCNSLGRSYLAAGKLKLAIPLLESTLEHMEVSLGEDDVIALSCRNNLAVAYEADGQPDRAIPLLQRTLNSRETKLGMEHPVTLLSLNNLAVAFNAAGQWHMAISLLERSVKAAEANLGEAHASTLKYRNNLAAAYRAAGQGDLAMSQFQRSLKAAEAKLGVDHPTTLICRHNLASAYSDAGQPGNAIPLLQNTLRTQENTLGKDHPDTLTSRNSLALVYYRDHQLDRAIDLYETNLKAREAKLGHEHPHTLISRSNLAVAYLDANKPELAIPLLESTLKVQETKLRSDHPSILIRCSNLGDAYQAVGKLDLAIPLLERTLKAQETTQGDDHPDTMTTRSNLAGAYWRHGKLNLAIPLFEKVVPQAKKKLGAAHPSTVVFTENWIVALESDHQYSRAVMARQELLVVQRKIFGSDDPRLGAALAQLGSANLTANEPANAERVLRESLGIRSKKEPDAWTTFNTQSLLGGALLGQKKYSEAEPFLLRGYQGMNQRQVKIPPQGKFRLTQALERLVQLYEATGMKDEAARWRKALDADKKKP